LDVRGPVFGDYDLSMFPRDGILWLSLREDHVRFQRAADDGGFARELDEGGDLVLRLAGGGFGIDETEGWGDGKGGRVGRVRVREGGREA